ncbi:hypothetical protein I8J29_24505 [Paenibacillus sp. MWE-103]|uniref:Uncharacterized protein n=1 Tax=Paenibacillus artemisiicola TaxID=1172618 RepID=A0ABS3WG90_9BACL|nr:hypothetical protein [Paenibacillus artemisiicola]
MRIVLITFFANPSPPGKLLQQGRFRLAILVHPVEIDGLFHWREIDQPFVIVSPNDKETDHRQLSIAVN